MFFFSAESGARNSEEVGEGAMTAFRWAPRARAAFEEGTVVLVQVRGTNEGGLIMLFEWERICNCQDTLLVSKLRALVLAHAMNKRTDCM